MAALSGSVIPGWDPFFEELSRMLRSAERQFGIASAEYSEYIIDRLETAGANVDNLESFCRNQPLHSDIEPITNLLRRLTNLRQKLTELVQQWNLYADRIELEAVSSCYMAPLQQSTGRRGRPRFSIDREQLNYLRSLSFSWVNISDLLGVSRMTVYRRRVEFGLVGDTAADVDDGTLTRIIGEIRTDLPEIGESMIMGRLRSMGLHIPRQRVRESIRTADPLNIALRWHGVTTRQPYSVPGPNSLWHIGMLL